MCKVALILCIVFFVKLFALQLWFHNPIYHHIITSSHHVTKNKNTTLSAENSYDSPAKWEAPPYESLQPDRVRIDDSLTLLGHVMQVGLLDVVTFLGIPYAEPPLGELRFEKPLPVDWHKRRDQLQVDHIYYSANEFGPRCIQVPKPTLVTSLSGQFMETMQKNQSEDCLYLNVYKPLVVSKDPLPVFFWIHGGGFTIGSGADIDSSVLSALGKMIVVSVNYRLGPFGFLYHGYDVNGLGSGVANQGLWDQALAMDWVHRHISAFGGDPQRITIAGESAGSIAVTSHLITPTATRNILAGAVIQSGSNLWHSGLCPSEAQRNTIAIAQEIGCDSLPDESIDSYKEIVQCLKRTPALKLVEVGSRMRENMMWGDEYNPTRPLDAVRMGHVPSHIPILAGNTDDESSIFIVPYENEFHPKFNNKHLSNTAFQRITNIFSRGNALIRDLLQHQSIKKNGDKVEKKSVTQAISNYLFLCPTMNFAYLSALSRKSVFDSAGVWSYLISAKPQKSFTDMCSQSPWMDTCHTDDLVYLFGLPIREEMNQIANENAQLVYSDRDRSLSKEVIKAWSTFTHKGKVPIDMQWPSLTSSRREPDDIDVHQRIFRHRDANQCTGSEVVYNYQKQECITEWLSIQPQCNA